jgi:hypothetical protein
MHMLVSVCGYIYKCVKPTQNHLEITLIWELGCKVKLSVIFTLRLHLFIQIIVFWEVSKITNANDIGISKNFPFRRMEVCQQR